MPNIAATIVLGAMALSLSIHAQGKEPHGNNITSIPAIATEQPKESIICHVYGSVINRPGTTTAMIVEAGKDFRIHDYITVPVTDGKFSYTLRDTVPMAYDVIFDDELKRGTWQIRNFYSGNGAVELFYYGKEEADKNRMESDINDNILAEKFSVKKKAEIQDQVNILYAAIDSLYENNTVYSKKIQALYDKAQSLPQGQERDSLMNLIAQRFKENREDKNARSAFYSEEYLKYEKELKDLYYKGDVMKRNFISENPSLFGLFSIREAIRDANGGSDWLDIPAYEDIFETLYKSRFPEHPYTEEIIGMLEARNIKEGNRYPDFKVTREDGSSEQVLSLIKDNVAVIDLWASWCSPCRKHSKELIPLYEKYKDRGFKVIAVARESDNCIDMNEAIEKDGYPWESFVDLNDRDNVWRINRAGNGGGKIILVNSDGLIVGTDMPIEEIKIFLEKAYGY